jgi:ribose 5-phosphate isomerase A
VKEVSPAEAASDPRARQKRAAAGDVVDEVRSGMVVGLGAGSPARFAVARIAERIEAGLLSDIAGAPCSRAVGVEATRLDIRLSTLDEHPVIDLGIRRVRTREHQRKERGIP